MAPVRSTNMRRLIKDQGSLQECPPPDYFFEAEYECDDLSLLSIYLVGPTETPYEDGVFRIALKIPQDYPATPPKATFLTKIFHPNVDGKSGDVCVDTLKRDWDPKLTLTDVLVTIRCLLVYPNATSALNESAGKLLLEDYDGFARHARLMTEIHAIVPDNLREAVRECRNRRALDDDTDDDAENTAPPPKREEPIMPSSSRTRGNAQPQQKQRRSKNSATVTMKRDASGASSNTQGERKIKVPVSPRARSYSNASDSEGSGKENVFTQRPESPPGIKRPRDNIYTSGWVEDEGLGGKEASGRKSPKLGQKEHKPVRKTLSKPKKSTAQTLTPAKRNLKKSLDPKKPGPRLGLKRY